MIIDKIDNSGLYAHLSDSLSKAFAFLHETDLATLAPGKHEIDGDEVFALILEYETKEQAACKLESHFRYIDLQYIITGTEYMGLCPLTGQKPVVENRKDDYAFYESEVSLMRFEPGMFAIFFPEDLHMTSIQIDAPSALKKVVVKVKL